MNNASFHDSINDELLAPEVFISVLQDTFADGRELSFIPSGNSMKPLLNGVSDKVTLSPKPDKLKKYDVALYLRPRSGQLVLHRMVGFTADGGYVFSGDAHYDYEYGITDDDVLALMTAYTRGGVERSVHSPRFFLYSRCMLMKKKLRMFASKVYHRFFK